MNKQKLLWFKWNGQTKKNKRITAVDCYWFFFLYLAIKSKITKKMTH